MQWRIYKERKREEREKIRESTSLFGRLVSSSAGFDFFLFFLFFDPDNFFFFFPFFFVWFLIMMTFLALRGKFFLTLFSVLLA